MKVCIVIIKLRCKLETYNVIYVTCEPDGQGSFDRRGSYRFCHLRDIHIGSVTDALSCEMFNGVADVFLEVKRMSHGKWVSVTTAWRVLRLRMEKRSLVWRVAAHISNKQSQTTDKGWSSSVEVGRGAKNSSP